MQSIASKTNKVTYLIAIVDANEPSRDSLEGVFSSKRFKVMKFKSYDDFLVNANMTGLHCLILNIDNVLGYNKFIKKFKSENNHVGVIIIGNNENFGEAVSAIKAGADDYISKPFDSLKLRALVNRYLSAQTV